MNLKMYLHISLRNIKQAALSKSRVTSSTIDDSKTEVPSTWFLYQVRPPLRYPNATVEPFSSAITCLIQRASELTLYTFPMVLRELGRKSFLSSSNHLYIFFIFSALSA
ncbi:hypothetical protein XENOCAPTIV_011669 [Xenoophorus captivus]|uniref:Uncharacterized protein n=1 Tax=Xenoophorus captivus TaxID=1517983 RepID=A0ABV0R3H6_9TELE